MNTAAKTALAIIGVLILLLGLLLGTFLYQTRFARTEILTETSPDGAFSLEIAEIGAPDWPFGATHCRFLLSGSKPISKLSFDIANDGCSAGVGQFTIQWADDRVIVTVHGEEQPDVIYHLFFDGTTEMDKTPWLVG